MQDRDTIYRFGPFTVDPRKRVLRHELGSVDLTPKTFDVLLALVDADDPVIEKQRLMERVWPNTFVDETNLAQQISVLRKKLAAHAGDEPFILTVPGRGYSLAMPVTRQAASLATDGVRPHRDLTTPLIACMVLLVMLASIVVWLYRERNASGASLASIALERITTEGDVTSVAISHDGTRVAFVERTSGALQIAVRPNGKPQSITPHEWVVHRSSFSPDDSYLYVVATVPSHIGTALGRIPMAAGSPAVLVDDVDTPPAFAPDANTIAYVRGRPDRNDTTLFLARPDGTGERALASIPASQGKFNIPGGPAWSPDGRRIVCAVTTTDAAGDYQALFEVSAADGARHQLTIDRWQRVDRAAWIDDRALIMIAADAESGRAQVWRVDAGTGRASRVTNDFSDYRDIGVSIRTRAIVTLQSDQRLNVWIAAVDDVSHATKVSSGNDDGFDALAWLADGRLAYTQRRNGQRTLWEIDPESGNHTQVELPVSLDGSLTFSPDDHEIAFASRKDGRLRIWRASMNGRSARPLTTGMGDDFPVVTPDGQSIVYRSYSTGLPNLFKEPLAGGTAERLTDGISGPPSISPNGAWLAFTYRTAGLDRTQLALRSLASQAPLTLLDVQQLPFRSMYRWTADGRALGYVPTADFANVWLLPVDGGAPSKLTAFDSESIANFAFSRDGRWIAISRGTTRTDAIAIVTH